VVLQLWRFSVLVSLVGLPLMFGGRAVEERPKVLVSAFNKAGVDDATVLLADEDGVADLRRGRFVDYLEEMSRAAGTGT
jgi:hypothetical protein